MKKIASFIATAILCASCVFPINMNGIKIGDGKTIKCGGPVTTNTFDLTGFNAISVNGFTDMELFQGDQFQVIVKANEDVFQYLDYKVEDGVLVMETKEHVNIKAETYEVTVTLPTLKNLTVNGAGDVELKTGYSSGEDLSVVINGAGDFELSGIKVPNFSITLNGAGDIEADGLDVENVSVAINGAGDINLSGKALKASFSVSGAGEIDASGLECDNVGTHKSGFAAIKLKK